MAKLKMNVNKELQDNLVSLVEFIKLFENKTIIYGAGSVAKLIIPQIKDKVIAIVDQDEHKIGTTIDGIKVISSKQLLKIDFSKIFISVLGRENTIKNYLAHEVGIPESKIEIFSVLSPHNISSDASIGKNINLKDKYLNKRCFILGNAPSINDIDLALLKDEHVFVMSTFYNHPDYKLLNQVFYTSVHLTGAESHQDKLAWMRAINDNQFQCNEFFFDLQQKEMIEEYGLFREKNVHYIQTSNLCERSFDLTKSTKSYATNVLQVLEIAIYMGFSEIFLHSVNINTICTGKYEYFFDRKLLPHKDSAVNDDNSVKSFLDEFNAFGLVLEELISFKKYIEKKKIAIYITNKESMLKIFDFKSFDEITF